MYINIKEASENGLAINIIDGHLSINFNTSTKRFKSLTHLEDDLLRTGLDRTDTSGLIEKVDTLIHHKLIVNAIEGLDRSKP